jgi:hypothetical protein
MNELQKISHKITSNILRDFAGQSDITTSVIYFIPLVFLQHLQVLR